MRPSIGAGLFLASWAFAQQHVKMIDISQKLRGIEGYADCWLSPDDIVQYQRNEKDLATARDQLRELADRSIPVLRFCPNLEMAKGQCAAPGAPPYPAFPLTDNYRNAMLSRPPPDVVRANIERATKGEMSTIEEIVAKVGANLHQLDKVSDDELALLASNFHQKNSGWIVEIVCEFDDFGMWSEDLLVPEEERRTLAAAMIYVATDPGYRLRLEEQTREAIRQMSPEEQEDMLKVRQAGQEEFWEQEQQKVLDAASLFLQRVWDLHDDLSVTKDEWRLRYDESLSAYEATVLDVLGYSGKEVPQADALSVQRTIQKLEKVADKSIFDQLSSIELAFHMFLVDEQAWPAASQDWEGFRLSARYSLSYNRWVAMSDEEKAPYVAMSEGVGL